MKWYNRSHLLNFPLLHLLFIIVTAGGQENSHDGNIFIFVFTR